MCDNWPDLSQLKQFLRGPNLILSVILNVRRVSTFGNVDKRLFRLEAPVNAANEVRQLTDFYCRASNVGLDSLRVDFQRLAACEFPLWSFCAFSKDFDVRPWIEFCFLDAWRDRTLANFVNLVQLVAFVTRSREAGGVPCSLLSLMLGPHSSSLGWSWSAVCARAPALARLLAVVQTADGDEVRLVFTGIIDVVLGFCIRFASGRQLDESRSSTAAPVVSVVDAERSHLELFVQLVEKAFTQQHSLLSDCGVRRMLREVITMRDVSCVLRDGNDAFFGSARGDVRHYGALLVLWLFRVNNGDDSATCFAFVERLTRIDIAVTVTFARMLAFIERRELCDGERAITLLRKAVLDVAPHDRHWVQCALGDVLRKQVRRSWPK